MIKKILLSLLALGLLAIVAVLLFFKKDAKNPYQELSWGRFNGSCNVDEVPQADYGFDFPSCDYTVPTVEIPLFEEVGFPFENDFDNTKSLPLMASALIDLNQDGIDEVFMGGGVDQPDALFAFENGSFKDVTHTHNLPAKPSGTTTYGVASFDIDADGAVDLLVAGDYGVKWYRKLKEGFESISIEVEFTDKSVPVGITLGDINQDGWVDMFISCYIRLDQMEGQTIFKDFSYGATSVLLINNGDNTFKDVTSSYGLEYIHNTFMAILVDVDKDGFLDLVVAHDTGEVRTYKNEQGQGFALKSNPTTGKYSYPMGIGVGDYNSDGLIDFFFSNTGTSVPEFLARGDLAPEDEFISTWMLFENQGNFRFKDVAKSAQIADFEFSWGAVFQDFNLDGKQDLVVAENYVDFPPHQLFKLPGRFLLQRSAGVFSAVEEQAGVQNKHYAISPLSSDFNQDGYPDLIFANINGKAKSFLNKGGSKNFLAVTLPETAAYVGTQVTVTRTDGSILSDVYVVGEGLSSDQSATLVFGLGVDSTVSRVEYRLPDGALHELANPKVNQVNKL